jgi:hypothetical protein
LEAWITGGTGSLGCELPEVYIAKLSRGTEIWRYQCRKKIDLSIIQHLSDASGQFISLVFVIVVVITAQILAESRWIPHSLTLLLQMLGRS